MNDFAQSGERILSPVDGERQPNFDFNFTLYRHGPKAGVDGPLTSEGAEESRAHLEANYRGVPLDAPVDIIHSGSSRAEQTSAAAVQSLHKRGEQVGIVREDARLS